MTPRLRPVCLGSWWSKFCCRL